MATEKPLQNEADNSNPIQLPSLGGTVTSEAAEFAYQFQFKQSGAGELYNSCRLIDGSFLDLLAKEQSNKKVKQLAVGLQLSGTKFIWVFRDADEGDAFEEENRRLAQLPEGFEERVEEMGMVVREWAPQIEILEHKSTGGFMSHCGWNSCLESFSNGVPVAAWHSDQPMNAILLVPLEKYHI
ncbi:zeatin O-xylosyltransferase [Ziziphus jujuba]|uniref:Zeatin O-xylosyltransferase n=1 Tax=Ziziphus jujuba TaxID=326968 RepID=A0A6P6FJP4_ZIZJJ|nr:zeatin O-xylosyltransferase [Ziziphus jujuba]